MRAELVELAVAVLALRIPMRGYELQPYISRLEEEIKLRIPMRGYEMLCGS